MNVTISLEDQQVDVIEAAFDLSDAAQGKKNDGYKAFSTLAVTLCTDWISGKTRFRSLTEMQIEMVQALYEALLPGELPSADHLFNKFNLPYGQASYIAYRAYHSFLEQRFVGRLNLTLQEPRQYGFAMLAHRSFTPSDIAAFAELSGDYNPLHVDPIAARRIIFGECVVHGVFVLLWALDRYQTDTVSRQSWSKLAVRFLRAARVGMPVSLTTTGSTDGTVNLAVTSDDRPILECDLSFSAGSDGTTQASIVRDSLPPREIPANPDLTLNNVLIGTLDLHYSREHGRRLFPSLTDSKSLLPIAALLAASRIVGMRVPGERSVFLQLNLGFSQHVAAGHTLGYRLAKYRVTSQRVAVAIEGAGCQGTLTAFVRPTPVAQPTMTVVKQRVPPGRFAPRRVLVIGGSRGLGEVAAKILAAGGAEVALTYRLGRDDAGKVAADVQKHGGTATCFQLDTLRREWKQSLSAHAVGFDHVCYFATPPITDGDGEIFSQPLFESFAAVYVSGLFDIAQWIADHTNGQFALFNASSVAVDSPPPRLLEYAAAKAASEACCRWLAARYPQARIHIARFPRLLTDQLASMSDPARSGCVSDSLEPVFAELTRWLPV